jgi:hypothetical protein
MLNLPRVTFSLSYKKEFISIFYENIYFKGIHVDIKLFLHADFKSA